MYGAKNTELNKIVFPLKEFTQVRETNISSYIKRVMWAMLGEHSPKEGFPSFLLVRGAGDL